MPVNSERELKQHLFDAYDGFADKRYRNIDRDDLFIIDDRTKADLDARGRLFLWFCQMFAAVRATDCVYVTLRGGTPASDGVSAWFDEHGGVQEAGGIGFEVGPGSTADLEDLAQRLETILKSPYDTKAYKYVVPRVAASLRNFRDVLDAAWR